MRNLLIHELGLFVFLIYITLGSWIRERSYGFLPDGRLDYTSFDTPFTEEDSFCSKAEDDIDQICAKYPLLILLVQVTCVYYKNYLTMF